MPNFQVVVGVTTATNMKLILPIFSHIKGDMLAYIIC